MKAVELTKELIKRPSVTPDDAGCQQLIADLLTAAGFRINWLHKEGVTNLYAQYGSGVPSLVLAGHTDVVPIGNISDWSIEPFEAKEIDGVLYGRGAADMKSGVAALVVAAIDVTKAHPHCRLGIILTSDEEGPAVSGMKYVVQWMDENNMRPRWCLLGEPSSDERLADTIRVGRRGSLTANMTIKGKQGHIAYPDLADNPIDKAAQIICAMRAMKWDEGYTDFPQTSCQFANINSGTGASNVIPADAVVQCNFRFNPASSAESLMEQTEAITRRFATKVEINWHYSGAPFYAEDQDFVSKVSDIVESVAGIRPKASTGGGTSDGRFIATLGTSVVELGVRNATIHQVDECVAIDEIERISTIYRNIIEEFAVEH